MTSSTSTVGEATKVERDTYLLVSLPDCFDAETIGVDTEIQVEGIDTDEPFFRLGDRYFSGRFEDSPFTTMCFSSRPNATGEVKTKHVANAEAVVDGLRRKAQSSTHSLLSVVEEDLVVYHPSYQNFAMPSGLTPIDYFPASDFGIGTTPAFDTFVDERITHARSLQLPGGERVVGIGLATRVRFTLRFEHTDSLRKPNSLDKFQMYFLGQHPMRGHMVPPKKKRKPVSNRPDPEGEARPSRTAVIKQEAGVSDATDQTAAAAALAAASITDDDAEEDTKAAFGSKTVDVSDSDALISADEEMDTDTDDLLTSLTATPLDTGPNTTDDDHGYSAQY